MKKNTLIFLLISLTLVSQTSFSDDCVNELAMQGEDWSAMFFSGMDFKDGKFCEEEDHSAEIYSDAMITLMWRYCVGSYGDSSTRNLLGYYSSWRDQGHELYPFTKIKKKRVRRNRAAKRVAQWAGNFKFVGNKSVALLALAGFANTAVGAANRQRGPITDHNGETLEDTMDYRRSLLVELANMNRNYGSLISQLKNSKSHPTKILSVQAINNMMNKCNVPKSKQKEYRNIAGTLSGMSSYLYNF